MPQCGASQQTEGTRERFEDLEVVELLADDELDVFPSSLYGLGEVTGLALKLRCFQSSVRDNQRSVEQLEVSL